MVNANFHNTKCVILYTLYYQVFLSYLYTGVQKKKEFQRIYQRAQSGDVTTLAGNYFHPRARFKIPLVESIRTPANWQL